jgi:hypothetical protein
VLRVLPRVTGPTGIGIVVADDDLDILDLVVFKLRIGAP